ncbi:MAG: tol-pal system YbgF family protein [Muribaculaceae bacterium]
MRDSKPDEAIAWLEAYLATPGASCLDVAYYLLGNAYRQKSDWRKAINNYNRAVQLNPDGPAKTALQTANEILDFFNHDLYNP